MEDLTALESLGLVSKVNSELQNHLGISDKTLAEFVIAQHEKSSSLDEFKSSLEAMGAEFPNSLIQSIDRLVLTLNPKYKAKEKKSNVEGVVDEKDRKARIFKGLAIPDAEPAFDAGNDGNDTLDDTFAALESLAKGTGPIGKKESGKRSVSPSDRDYRNGSNKRSRRSSPSRSKRKEDYGFMFDDGNGNTIEAPAIRPRGRNKDRRRNYEEDDRFDRPPPVEVDDEPILYKCYRGHVTGVKSFGCFVNLHNIKGSVDGLVHVSAMREGRVNDPSDFVSKGQEVWVKVTKIEGSRLSLSMKEVDQVTGRDLDPYKRIEHASGANSTAVRGRLSGNGQFDSPQSSVPVVEGIFSQKRDKKRLTSPERFEIKQLIASGVMSATDYPDIDEEYNEHGMREDEEDVDIEVREEEPPFLAGQTKQSLELSPIRIVKAPDGSMNRAAMSGEQIARERRELRQQEAQDKAVEEATKVDLSTQWNDPLARPDERKFASDLRSKGRNEVPDAMPEWKRISQGKEKNMGKRSNLSIKEQRETLPVFQFRNQFLEAVKVNQVMIVVGETGSGKTTQLTQYLAEAGYAGTNNPEMGQQGIIGCTQPRRVAAMSVAARVAEEVGCLLGNEVGYTIRFEDKTSADTKIKYMTDGILQREILLSPNLERYSVIMLDEAHERTIATDVLFALIRKALKRRPDLKLIVTSATLDADKFSSYFGEAPIFTIPGRTFPVQILYAKEPESDYVSAAITTVITIHLSEDLEGGDILVFLTGRDEIDTACSILQERMDSLGRSVPELLILPIYAALPTEVATRVFEPAGPGQRKVIIATNIAETSLTLEGVRFVVDTGFVKVSAYNPKMGMDTLQVSPISQAQAKQRAGRAGRTAPGTCYRLYTEAAYNTEMLATSLPEIQRSNMANTVLLLKAMGINDLLSFPWMDPPPVNVVLTALEELYALGALDDEGLLTRQGRQLADYPMDPTLGKTMLASVSLQCSDEVLSIIAMVTGAQNVFYRPKEKAQQADQKRTRFFHPKGDHLTLLNVYQEWLRSGMSAPWCHEHFLQQKSLRRIKDVREQLVQIVQRQRHKIVSCGRDTDRVLKSLCAGFFRHAVRKDPHEGFKTLVEGTPVYMHPSSALFGKPGEWAIYQALVMTSKEYMHNVTAIDPRWLVEFAPTFFKVAGKDGLSKRKLAERIQPLHNRFAGEDDWRLSAQKRQGRGGGGTWG
ncbi:putative RNA helicase-like splicing factor [Patellaria atrata CBS 101060]|uniref:RNA helicase n=1 Tax=Patellaria atrata CBS 101060 TaxID=1346257 RepID=A0A9P4SBQ9_9PEZI|nr:putative RNA helicase-like splicing factor [Patellaria atrata CBS 101060]